MSAESTDEELMLAYVAGDARAFRALFERYAPRIQRMVRRHVDSDDDARDIVQQTFLRLHAARFDFRQGAAVRPWTMTIAMNLVRERWRTAKRRRMLAFDESAHEGGAAPSERLEASQARARVDDALSRLPAAQREVVVLHWIEELPFSEVASIVGAKEGAVRVRAHRAYEKLRSLLVDGMP